MRRSSVTGRNAVQGLLFASSLLYFFDEQSKALAT
jgi:hypothetical protein